MSEKRTLSKLQDWGGRDITHKQIKVKAYTCQKQFKPETIEQQL